MANIIFDKCLNKIPHENVKHIYEGWDIYWLESFIHPSLGLMATDGYSIDGEKCL